MKHYIGTKIIRAKPMTRLDYNNLRGWGLPADENGDDPGYLVEYVDGGPANVPGFAGYVSWSPADVFERSYRQTGTVTRSRVCGVDCKPGGELCNGYCTGKRERPETYENALLTFGDALELLKLGAKVARLGWNGKGMWVALSPGHAALEAEKFWAGPNREYAEQAGGSVEVLPCFTMKTADGRILMGWLATQSDMLEDDWVVVP